MKPELRSVWATVGASVVLAVVAFVMFVLPAEFGRDPTGFGTSMGITGMAGYQVAALHQEERLVQRDRVQFPLAPFESVEYKYEMAAGQAMVFDWSAAAPVVFDMHSEELGRDPDAAVSFATGTAPRWSGSYVAPFDGVHGWFWENRGTREVTVEVVTSGFYSAAITYGPGGPFRREFVRSSHEDIP